MEREWTSAVSDTSETTYVFFTTLVRDQEVDGSNPFAPTTSPCQSSTYSNRRRFEFRFNRRWRGILTTFLTIEGVMAVSIA